MIDKAPNPRADLAFARDADHVAPLQSADVIANPARILYNIQNGRIRLVVVTVSICRRTVTLQGFWASDCFRHEELPQQCETTGLCELCTE